MNEKGSEPPSYTSQPGGGYGGLQGYPQGSQPPPGQYPQGPGQYPQVPGQYPQAQPGQYPQAPPGQYPQGGYQPGVQYAGGNTVVVTGAPPPQQPRTPLPCSYIVGLVFAILSFFLGCWVLAIPAIIFAALSLGTHANDPRGAKTQCLIGMGLTIASFVISAIIIIVIVVFVVQAATEIQNAHDDFNQNWNWN